MLFIDGYCQPEVSQRARVSNSVPMMEIPVGELGSIEEDEQVSTSDFVEKTQKWPMVRLVDGNFNRDHPKNPDRVE